MSYFVAPLSKTKTQFPEFAAALSSLEQGVRNRAETIWPGYSFGGLQPGANQYGLANLVPRHMSIHRGFGSWSFLQKFTAPGSWSNIYSYTCPVDQVHGHGGIELIGASNPFTALRYQISDTTLPIFEIEESRVWDPASGVAIVVKTDQGKELVQQEKASIILKGFADRNTSGFNVRAVPIGLMAYRARDDLLTLAAPSL